MPKRTIKVTSTDVSYADYLTAYEDEKGTQVGALQKLAFVVKMNKGKSVTAGDITFTPDPTIFK